MDTRDITDDVQAAARTCPHCGRSVHPDNWQRHQQDYHSEHPVALHETNARLPLAAIRADGGTQPRALIDAEVVKEYTEGFANGDKFPAITVFYDGSTYWLADGFHRVQAAEAAGMSDILADVRQGTQRDAILYSAGANAHHGLRRTNADKRRAVERLLRDDEWSQWSDREIARRCEVSNRFVSTLRHELSVNSTQIRMVSRNGSTYSQNTTNIGAKPALPDNAPVFIRDAVDDGWLSRKQAVAIANTLTTATPEVVRLVEQYQLDDVDSVTELKRLQVAAPDTFEEIVHSGYIQPGEADEAVPVSAGYRALKGALELKARFHAQLALEAEAARIESVVLPNGKYRCIVCDPPWPMKKIVRRVRPRQGAYLDYPTMTLDAIAALPVGDLAYADGCHLYLWATQKYLPKALELVCRWGFRYECLMTWVKPTGITPYSWMYNTEFVVFARHGHLPLLKYGEKLSFEAPVTEHSVKPDAFYERVRKASPGPRLDMFARRERDGFAAWGGASCLTRCARMCGRIFSGQTDSCRKCDGCWHRTRATCWTSACPVTNRTSNKRPTCWPL